MKVEVKYPTIEDDAEDFISCVIRAKTYKEKIDLILCADLFNEELEAHVEYDTNSLLYRVNVYIFGVFYDMFHIEGTR